MNALEMMIFVCQQVCGWRTFCVCQRWQTSITDCGRSSLQASHPEMPETIVYHKRCESSLLHHKRRRRVRRFHFLSARYLHRRCLLLHFYFASRFFLLFAQLELSTKKGSARLGSFPGRSQNYVCFFVIFSKALQPKQGGEKSLRGSRLRLRLRLRYILVAHPTLWLSRNK